MVFHPPVAIVAKAGDAGKYKVGLPAWNMLLRGVLSGAFIAMGAALATVCSTGIQATDVAMRFGAASPGISQLVLGAVFPVGLIITIMTGAELFTGDAMLAPMAAFVHKVSWASVLNLWVWVYIGNFIGSVIFAYIMAYGPCVSYDAAGVATVTAFGTRAIGIAAAKTGYVGGMALWSCFLKAIACNWLVNLAVLLGICADDAIGKIVGIWFPIFAFVASGFEHSIANMYFIPAGIFVTGIDPTKAVATVNWVNMWTNNVIPVTLGNIVGGLFFVGVLYWVAFRKEIAALK
ncbi:MULTISPECIES: formate/nitrite transporter family protein [unclassified Methanoculleus]|uniref:formate/nitrite transporter family protein n=1 Tax=unclassified Methanoculleus TaxID=2619537 RepID=UPI0025F9AE38|nr:MULTISPECIES: formate/nitrite transporter family protein [unclassified Methanoculleus]MCK9317870.1 formate/nitrite transporter family protein [Methanoculleus sp.]MDD2253094.1 formate/nitrite transporter family protein [Methanoculleus sp.]MDD2787050.1 formate/nitrite transporter family protein [Methanoculleus sp.]MDD3216054.1 formate/nitrite transporter family protein [Methanoculleus sp.]MDD4313298.1 formate/nitrite transporter family protein [Methanoculleus sp.]